MKPVTRWGPAAPGALLLGLALAGPGGPAGGEEAPLVGFRELLRKGSWEEALKAAGGALAAADPKDRPGLEAKVAADVEAQLEREPPSRAKVEEMKRIEGELLAWEKLLPPEGPAVPGLRSHRGSVQRMRGLATMALPVPFEDRDAVAQNRRDAAEVLKGALDLLGGAADDLDRAADKVPDAEKRALQGAAMRARFDRLAAALERARALPDDAIDKDISLKNVDVWAGELAEKYKNAAFRLMAIRIQAVARCLRGEADPEGYEKAMRGFSEVLTFAIPEPSRKKIPPDQLAKAEQFIEGERLFARFHRAECQLAAGDVAASRRDLQEVRQRLGTNPSDPKRRALLEMSLALEMRAEVLWAGIDNAREAADAAEAAFGAESPFSKAARRGFLETAGEEALDDGGLLGLGAGFLAKAAELDKRGEPRKADAARVEALRRAERVLARADAEEGDLARALFLLGRAHYERGEYYEAGRSFRRYLERHPKGDKAEEARKGLYSAYEMAAKGVPDREADEDRRIGREIARLYPLSGKVDPLAEADAAWQDAGEAAARKDFAAAREAFRAAAAAARKALPGIAEPASKARAWQIWVTAHESLADPGLSGTDAERAEAREAWKRALSEFSAAAKDGADPKQAAEAAWSVTVLRYEDARKAADAVPPDKARADAEFAAVLEATKGILERHPSLEGRAGEVARIRCAAVLKRGRPEEVEGFLPEIEKAGLAEEALKAQEWLGGALVKQADREPEGSAAGQALRRKGVDYQAKVVRERTKEPLALARELGRLAGVLDGGKDSEGQIRYLEEAVARFGDVASPSEAVSKERAGGILRLVNALQAAGRGAEARPWFPELRRIYPDIDVFKLEEAEALMATGKLAEARPLWDALWTKWLKWPDKSPSVWTKSLLGLSECDLQDPARHETAVQRLWSAVQRLHPANSERPLVAPHAARIRSLLERYAQSPDAKAAGDARKHLKYLDDLPKDGDGGGTGGEKKGGGP